MPSPTSRTLPRPADPSPNGPRRWPCGGWPEGREDLAQTAGQGAGTEADRLIAAGAFADPEAIPFLIDQMKVPELARVAGESFSMITGADIA